MGLESAPQIEGEHRVLFMTQSEAQAFLARPEVQAANPRFLSREQVETSALNDLIRSAGSGIFAVSEKDNTKTRTNENNMDRADLSLVQIVTGVILISAVLFVVVVTIIG